LCEYPPKFVQSTWAGIKMTRIYLPGSTGLCFGSDEAPDAVKAAKADSGAMAFGAARRQIIRVVHTVAGIAAIVACLEGGILIQQYLRIPVPGSVLGMVLLLVLLQTKLVPDAWIRGPCTALLLLLPALFVPLYVVPLSDPAFWRHYSMTLLPAAVIGVAVTLCLTGYFARRMRRL
jgi:holin-like protein